MQHHGDLAFEQAKPPCGIRVKNGIHNADFEEMISGAKGSKLFFAPVQSPFADFGRICIGQASAVFGMLQVGLFPRPWRTAHWLPVFRTCFSSDVDSLPNRLIRSRRECSGTGR